MDHIIQDPTYIFKILSFFMYFYIEPHTPVAQKIADEVFFRRFQGEGVEFF